MYIFIIKEFVGFGFASLEIAIKQPYHQFAYLMPPILKTKHESNVFSEYGDKTLYKNLQ